MCKKVFVSFPINLFELYDPLKKEGFEVIFGIEPAHPMIGERKAYSEDEVIEKCRWVDAVLGSPRLPLTSRVLNSADRLVCICQRGIGFDNVDVETASKLGILVTNAPIEVDFVCVAEHTVALSLALAKKLNVVSKIICEGAQAYYDERVSTVMLNGKTVGIIGLGRIGARVAALLRPLNVKLLGYDPYISEESVRSMGVQLVDLETLLKESDFATIHVPLSKETYHMIGRKELAMMKNTAYIVNTARGAIIDEAALVDVLMKGKIAGAALDVLEKEPASPDNPLLKMDNVIITPHIAGRNAESLIEGERVAVESCLKILKGEVPNNVVNPEAIPKWKKRMGLRA